MANFKELSLWIKLSLVILIIANTFSVISFTTTAWAKQYHPGGKNTGFGIWQACYPGECEDRMTHVDIPDWLRAAQCFLTVGFLMLLGGGLAILAYVVIPEFEDMTVFPLAGGGCAIGSIIFTFVGAVTFAVHQLREIEENGGNGQLHYSFGLCIVSMILAIPGGVMAFMDLMEK